jgi:hypothetical protein
LTPLIVTRVPAGPEVGERLGTKEPACVLPESGVKITF